jgi:hypothetical protein
MCTLLKECPASKLGVTFTQVAEFSNPDYDCGGFKAEA